MNKVMDGYVALNDSYKPVLISTDREHYAYISFVGEQVVIRTSEGTNFEIDHTSHDSLIFKLVEAETDATAKPAENIPERLQQNDVVE